MKSCKGRAVGRDRLPALLPDIRKCDGAYHPLQVPGLVRGTKAPMLLNAVDTATGLVAAQLPIQNKIFNHENAALFMFLLYCDN